MHLSSKTRFAFSGLLLCLACSDPKPSQKPEARPDQPQTQPQTQDEDPSPPTHEPKLPVVDLRAETLTNPAAYLTPQCYTKTEPTKTGKAANPCFTCHVKARSPNFVGDDDLQQEYSFAEPARKNRWTNLFVDRREAIQKMPDSDIEAYVDRSNYFDEKGGIILANTLKTVPKAWDINDDGHWNGYVPDAYFNFDAEGFDRDPSGQDTGWRAFSYYPTPGTFWPTNGSISDVLIRLPKAFREDASGKPSRAIYKLNLAIVEALFQRKNIPIAKTDEKALGVDLNKNGKLDPASEVVFDWEPLKGRNMSYVGAAKGQKLAEGLYPLGTEFLHTVRYLKVAKDASVGLGNRLKELRYAVKTHWQTYSELESAASDEVKEKHDFPDRLKEVWGTGTAERGIVNGRGWKFQGFIEDAKGDLRPQSFEEHVYCIGCHGGIGGNQDSIFAFSRKLDSRAHAGGWYHGSQKGMKGIPDRVRRDGRGEYALYLEENQAGDEFRDNGEVIARFFDAKGRVKADMKEALKKDVSVLIWPSKRRALDLNKAYRTIVLAQNFIKGRDANLAPVENVHKATEEDQVTGVETPITADWQP